MIVRSQGSCSHRAAVACNLQAGLLRNSTFLFESCIARLQHCQEAHGVLRSRSVLQCSMDMKSAAVLRACGMQHAECASGVSADCLLLIWGILGARIVCKFVIVDLLFQSLAACESALLSFSAVPD